MNNTYFTIQTCLNELSCTCYHDICSAYFVARLIIAYSKDGNYADTFLYSSELQRILHIYREVVPDELTTEYIDTWVTFCGCLQDTGLDKDHISFFDEFSPAIVQNWKSFSSFFPQVGSLLVALILILRSSSPCLDTILEDELHEEFTAKAYLYRRCGLDYIAFRKCWSAVYTSPLFSSAIHRSTSIIKAINIYHQLYLPMSDLLNDYALLLLCDKAVAHQYAIRGNRRKRFDKPAIESARSTTDQQLENALLALQNEKPTDVIRGLFYRGRNDSGIECTYVLQSFLCSITPTTQNLIVNPSPDFLLHWPTNINATFFVPQKILSDLYSIEFQNSNFICADDFPSLKEKYDRILILARDMRFEDYSCTLESAAENASITALIPERALRILQSTIKSLVSPLSVRNVIHLPSILMESQPKRKILAFVNSDNQTDYFQLLSGACDREKTQFTIEKNYYTVPYAWFDSTLSLLDARNAINKQQVPITRKFTGPKVYSFSPEIDLYYTIQMDCKNRVAGRVCYRAILRKHQKHRKRGDILTKTVEKGLRHRTFEEVLGAIELAALYDNISPYIVDDVLNFYTDNLSGLSLKTVWFCLRAVLLPKASYNEEVALQLFCGKDQSLSALCIGRSTIEDYEQAMLSLFPEECSIRQKHWDTLNMILSAAAKNKYIPFNPLAEAMPIITAKISDRQKRSRNTLVKRTLEFAEEERMFAFLMEPTGELFCSREIRRFERGNGWAAALLHMFTPLSLREICALRWENLQRIPGLSSYHFIVRSFLTDSGQLKTVINQRVEKNRSIPIASSLASLLMEYKDYLSSHFSMSEDRLSLWPIVLETFPKSKFCHIPKLCTVKAAAARCKELIQVAGIRSNEIVLPDDIYGEHRTDLNTYHGDLLYTNIRARLLHTCKLTVAETQYLLGLKAPTTLMHHYVEHGTPAHQHKMALKQSRWISRYIPAKSTPSSVSADTLIEKDWQHSFNSGSTEIPIITVTISSSSEQVLPKLDLSISNKHGVDGNIYIYKGES